MKKCDKRQVGFSILELMIAMTIILIVLGLVMTLFGKSLGSRQRESSRTDALTAAQAALNVISREVANSGYGLKLEDDARADNGLVDTDSDAQTIHFRANTTNDNIELTDPGEDVTYYYEPGTQSILRYDANGNGPGDPQTSIVINRISSLNFQYHDYSGVNPVPTIDDVPTVNTGRVRVTVTVNLERVIGEANPQNVVLVSDVTLRNSEYMLQQY
jgi:prepilin-type N-terminal cleavage/methylation domain-containing protein